MKPTSHPLTIILPCYNAVQELPKAVESLQSLRPLGVELIIVDGNSTDGTRDWLQAHGSEFTFISEPDSGVYDAMNKGISRATGKRIFFMGADDRWTLSAEKLQSLLSQSSQNQIPYGNVRLKTTQKIYGGPFYRWKLLIKNISHQAILYPKEVFQKKRYDLSFPICADHAFNLELAWNPDFQFKYHELVLTEFGQGGLSSRVNDPAFENMRRQWVQDHGSAFEKLLFYTWEKLRSKKGHESH